MTSNHEEVRSDLSRRMTQPIMNLVRLDLIPNFGVESQDVNIVEAHMTVTTANHDQLVINDVAGMIPSPNRNLPLTFPFPPLQSGQIRAIHRMHVIQRSDAIATAKNDHVMSIKDVGRVRTTWRRWGTRHNGLRPPQRDRIENVEIVEVVRTISAGKHE